MISLDEVNFETFSFELCVHLDQIEGGVKMA